MGTLTVANYKTSVRTRLQNITVDDSALLQFANDANREVCNYQIPGMVWRFLQDNFVGTLTSGDLQYDFESNWKRPTDITLTAPDSNAAHLEFKEYQQFRQLYPDPTAATESVPSIWTVRGRTFLIGPNPPDQTYTLDAAFEKLPTTLTDEAETLDVPDDGSELIVLGMLRRALMLRRRYDQAQVIAQDWDLAMAQFIPGNAVSEGLPSTVNSGWVTRGSADPYGDW